MKNRLMTSNGWKELQEDFHKAIIFKLAYEISEDYDGPYEGFEKPVNSIVTDKIKIGENAPRFTK